MRSPVVIRQPVRRDWFRRRIKPNLILYLFMIPVIIYAITFWYAPMFGLVMSFQRYNPGKGFLHSDWVGLYNFRRFFNSYMSLSLIQNTLSLSLYYFIANIPIPIMLALSFRYAPSARFAKVTQTISYAPHFISTVVMVGMLNIFLSPRTGFVNFILEALGGERINFMAEAQYFHHIYVLSGIWQGAGWSSVMYTAALAGVDPSLHEVARVDGASLLQRIWYVDLPVIAPTFIVLQILGVGSLLNVGYEKAYLMQNPGNISASQIISTYTYSMGILKSEYSYTAAIGLFNNVINFILLMLTNLLARRVSDVSIM